MVSSWDWSPKGNQKNLLRDREIWNREKHLRAIKKYRQKKRRLKFKPKRERISFQNAFPVKNLATFVIQTLVDAFARHSRKVRLVRSVPRDPGTTILTAGASSASVTQRDLPPTSVISFPGSAIAWQDLKETSAISAVPDSTTSPTAGPATVTRPEPGRIRSADIHQSWCSYFFKKISEQFLNQKIALRH